MEYYSNLTDRAWIDVDLGALRHNLLAAKSVCGRVMAVIKGNALGLGAKTIGAHLAAWGCDAFGVACLDEAVELRSAVSRPILILGYTPAHSAADLVQYGLTQTVVDRDHAAELQAAAAKLGRTIDVHIKLDTGMSRFGILAQGEEACAAAAAQALEIFRMENLRVTGIFTHFSMADMPDRDGYTAWQLENFQRVVGKLREAGVMDHVLCHTANSAGLLFHPEAAFDMVRAGAMLFGVNPHGTAWTDGTLLPVVSLQARIAQVKVLPAGASVSYGGLYRTVRETKIAVVPVGFADGYIRNWTGKGMYAVIRGVRCPQIGRICMDCCVFDVTEASAGRGDVAVLLGGDALSLDDAACLGGTNNMEPIILRGDRVPVRCLNEPSACP